MRKAAAPSFSLAEQTARADWLTLRIEAVTPIYRGGAGQNQFDVGRPFRGPSLRGLLRSWWRATSTCATVQELWQAERALWGGVFGNGAGERGRGLASRVRVHLTELDSTATNKGTREYDYALWVDGDGKERCYHAPGASAVLHLGLGAPPAGSGAAGVPSSPLRGSDPPAGAPPPPGASEQEHLRKAVVAWALFGGVGSRSRRGLGKVWTDDLGELGALATLEHLRELHRSLCPAVGHALWPTLGRSRLFVGEPQDSAMDAWKAALHTLQALRMSTTHEQAVPARVPPGYDHNQWRAEDYLKWRARQSFTSGRAALGLPLQFQGWDGAGRWFTGGSTNRVPSPVLQGPLKVGGRWYPFMLRLHTPYPQDLRLTVDGVGGRLDPAGVDRFLNHLARTPGWQELT